jgi:hypothetical protein
MPLEGHPTNDLTVLKTVKVTKTRRVLRNATVKKSLRRQEA